MLENDEVRLPEIIVFAGPNGSGKSTITKMSKIVGEYINADDIKRATLCTDLEAAVKAEELRERMIENKDDFTFETVLSTDRNLLFLQRAKERGYFIRGIYVLTSNADINVARVQVREALGGHGDQDITGRLLGFPSWLRFVTFCIYMIIQKSHSGYLRREGMYIFAGVINIGVTMI